MPQSTELEKASEFSGRDNRPIRGMYVGALIIVCTLFVALNLRHLSEPFRDYGKPFAGEPFYAIRALNYLRHGYFGNWLGVCDNLNPHPEQLRFKFTEMPAYFVLQSLSFRLFGVSTLSFRVVGLGYGVVLFIFVSSGTWKLFDEKTAVLTSLLMLLIPVNMFLLYTAWIFVFPVAALFFYVLWSESRSRIYCLLAVFTAALGCLHHVIGYLVAPAVLIRALLGGSFRRDSKALAGILGTCILLGAACLAQMLLLRHSLEIVGEKALSESILNLTYLKGFFSLNIAKLIPNYHELLTVPVPALAIYWTVRTVASKKKGPGDWFLLLSLFLPVMFFLVFLGMVGSHLHFLALFSPFLALSSSRALLGPKSLRGSHRILQLSAITLLAGYLAFMTYRTQHKYDVMIWNAHNERGYALAEALRNMVGEDESIAGVNDFGYGYNTMSPAFYFYLRRNYYGGVSSLSQLFDVIRDKKISIFLLPKSLPNEGDTDGLALSNHLIKNYRFLIDPARQDMVIFDLRNREKVDASAATNRTAHSSGTL